MNAKIYTALFVSLITFSAGAMEQVLREQCEDSAVSNAVNANETKYVSIRVAMPRNGRGAPSIEELDLDEKDPILLDTFEDLLRQKHERKLPYIIARTVTQTEDGSVVNYLDAHGFNKVFGNYPFERLDALSKYKNPVSNIPLQWLEYYECVPEEKVFEFVCSYVAICTNSDKSQALRCRLYANQESDLKLAADAMCRIGHQYYKGIGVGVDYVKAEQFLKQAANQTDHLGHAADAWCILGNIYCNERVADYEKGKQCYERAANQTDSLGAAAIGKCCLGHMYYKGKGIGADYAKAEQLLKQAANQTDHLAAAASARNSLKELEQLMSKNA